ncbi:hypothetical protein SGI37_20280, partial [Providencia rettgeri]
ISEKVRNKSLFLLKSQKKNSGDKVEESKKSQNSSSSSESKIDNTICEATMCLLMDRFAPC